MQKKNLLIVGAGDFGREMESWLELLPGFHEKWNIAGYLDQNPNALDGFPTDFKIVGTPTDYIFAQGDYAVMCISASKAKQFVAEKLAGKVQFLTYIAPSSIIGKFSKIGEGAIIAPNCVISTNVEIGDFSIINIGSQIGHDVKIGKYSSIMANVDFGGRVQVGERTFAGTNATIIPGKKVVNDTIIGAGSIVLRSIKKPGTYFGNPAKLIM